jgi:hypothetical protein
MVVVCNGLYHTGGRHQDFEEIHDHGLNNLNKLEGLGKEKFDQLIR